MQQLPQLSPLLILSVCGLSVVCTGVFAVMAFFVVRFFSGDLFDFFGGVFERDKDAQNADIREPRPERRSLRERSQGFDLGEPQAFSAQAAQPTHPPPSHYGAPNTLQPAQTDYGAHRESSPPINPQPTPSTSASDRGPTISPTSASSPIHGRVTRDVTGRGQQGRLDADVSGGPPVPGQQRYTQTPSTQPGYGGYPQPPRPQGPPVPGQQGGWQRPQGYAQNAQSGYPQPPPRPQGPPVPGQQQGYSPYQQAPRRGPQRPQQGGYPQQPPRPQGPPVPGQQPGYGGYQQPQQGGTGGWHSPQPPQQYGNRPPISLDGGPPQGQPGDDGGLPPPNVTSLRGSDSLRKYRNRDNDSRDDERFGGMFDFDGDGDVDI